MNNSTAVIEEYVAALTPLRRAIEGMTRAQLTARPISGQWTTLEVLCHLVDAELTTSDRVRRMLASDRPHFLAIAREQMSALTPTDARDAGEELAVIELLRRQTARILRSMPPEALKREAVLHKPSGEEVVRTVSQFLSGITGHVAHHLRFIVDKRRALGLPDAG